MSEFKNRLPNKAAAILFCYLPRLVMLGPYPDTLAKWDELLQEGKTVAIGGSDAHGVTYHSGPLSTVVQPSLYLFRAVNTHILSREAFNGQLTHDKRVVYDALREGRCFVAYDLLTGTKSGKDLAWFRRGCTVLRAGSTMLTTRFQGNAAYVDLDTGQITSIWNVRAACSNNLFPANGVLNLPNLTAGCTCNYLPISQALVPTSVME